MSEEGTRKKGLGRGLSALLGDEPARSATMGSTDGPLREARDVPIELIHPGRFQPRRTFSPEALEELAASIRERGVLQPLLLRPAPQRPGEFELVAGERRWRAAQMARLHAVPAVIRAFDDRAALEIAIVENVQRRDLAPLEEAQGYRRLQDEFGYTQEAIAKGIGKSRAHVTNLLRLLALPPEVLAALEAGRLSAGHGKILVGLPDAVELAREIVERGLSVRQAEELAQIRRKSANGRPAGQGARQGRAGANRLGRAAGVNADPDIAALERELEELLGMQVRISGRDEKGELLIRYSDLEQLDDLLRRLRLVPATPIEDPL